MVTIVNKALLPKPFLKWAGGKRQLLPELLKCVMAAEPFGRYHEPFVGGGALFFELFRLNWLGHKQAYLSDTNGSLIEAYQGVKQDVEQVITLLNAHKQNHHKEYYYRIRSHVPDDPIARAARIIYLNKTCFNGLFRENSNGGFNVPIGKYKDPAICDEDNLRAVACALKKADLERRSFEDILDAVESGDLVYFDPPYHPVSETSSFTKYDKTGFGEPEQLKLAGVFTELDKMGVKVLLSNSMTPFIQNIYRGFHTTTVYATRSINSLADGRGKIQEILIHNFPVIGG